MYQARKAEWRPPAPAPSPQAKTDAEALCEERCQLALQQQALKYERRISELEVAGCGEPGRTFCGMLCRGGGRKMALSQCVAEVSNAAGWRMRRLRFCGVLLA